MSEKYEYIAFYKNDRVDISASSMYEAKQKALQLFNPSKKDEWHVHVVLAGKNGQPVKHVAVD